MMKKREQEILNTILLLSEKTRGFTEPELIMIGGYALRAFIPLSRFTRDCDFALRKREGWGIDEFKALDGYSVEQEEKRGSYGFLRCVKFLEHDKARVKVSMDFMEGEIRGRKAEEVILIDEAMMKKRKFTTIPIADKPVRIPVPDYVDYFIMKVVSGRASDIRDIASLVHENGIPSGLEERINQILPSPTVFKAKIDEKILPEMKRTTFINSWRGIFGTLKYSDADKMMVIKLLEKLA
jgi:hypothetical protein